MAFHNCHKKRSDERTGDFMKIGVIGAGTMGKDIAMLLAKREENEIYITASSKASAERHVGEIEAFYVKRIKRNKMTEEEAKANLSRINPVDISECKECDLIIESIVEEYDTKIETLNYLSKICRDDAIFTTNTSSLSVERLGDGVKQEFLGMHFFNPAMVMKLVEVVPSSHCSKETTERIVQKLRAIGKDPVVCTDSPGFLVNRILLPMINCAAHLYEDGNSDLESIDKAMKLGANFPMGPLELADYIGLDICVAIMNTFVETLGDEFKPADILLKKVEEGKLGRKTGEGLYKY